ncbi:MAG: 50S ribosomal protein L11 methyltransferase [Candidatus Promineifilaceae bacterium]|nr:50S ribosomal protein L11 methyltransferase [Candidatus Promineifilaceae bacterium]
MTAFTEVSVKVDGEAAEAVAEVLRPFAYQDAVALEQYGDPDDPDPAALEPDVTVKIYIPEDDDRPELRRRIEEILYHLNRLYPVPAPTFRILQDTDWANAWKEHYKPFRIGEKIWIQPSWYVSDDGGDSIESVNPDDIVLTLDPGMAFGTGLHPTTQKSLQAIEQVIQPGDQVLDIGTGSGILAIAAIKLGAAGAVGVDTDELAIKSALANAQLNGVDDVIQFWQGDLQSVSEGKLDIVVVNILAPVIEVLLQQFHLLNYVDPNGWLILSGIIDSQQESLEYVVAEMGGVVVRSLTVQDWVTLLVRPNNGS